jgi:hypothetical protein
MASYDTENKKVIASLGGLWVILSAMTSHHGHDGIQQASEDARASLSGIDSPSTYFLSHEPVTCSFVFLFSFSSALLLT